MREGGKSKPAQAHRQTSQMEERSHTLCFSLMLAQIYKGEEDKTSREFHSKS
jgi:hypothetical protein